MSLLKCSQKNSGRFVCCSTTLTNSGILSWSWHEHHRNAECMIALMIQIDGEERVLSGVGMDVLESGTPRVYPARVVSVLNQDFVHKRTTSSLVIRIQLPFLCNQTENDDMPGKKGGGGGGGEAERA